MTADGTSYEIDRGYDSSGLISAAMTWDLNGNLSTRQDLNQSLTETFVYDSLDRLDYGQRNGVTNLDVTLDTIGNINWMRIPRHVGPRFHVMPARHALESAADERGIRNWKQGIGNYSYHATKKRAVIAAGSHTYGYDANGNLTSRDGSTIGYTSYNLPGVINAGSNSSTLSYGAFRNRYKQVAVTAGVTETTIYVGGILEKVTRSGVTEYRHRIEGGNGTAAIYTRRTAGTPLTETYYVHRDHLGSPELITNAAGAVVVRLSFSAYGERRDSDWDGAVSSADMTAIGNTTRRGFTGHEHLDSVSLIHMNGRVFEPIIGRMLSPDAIVQIGAAQSVNCYAYVWNNPLTRTDPSGWEARHIGYSDGTRPRDPWRDAARELAKLAFVAHLIGVRPNLEWEPPIRPELDDGSPGGPTQVPQTQQPAQITCSAATKAAAATMIEMLSGGFINTDFERAMVINFLSHGPDVQLSARQMLTVRTAVSADFARTATGTNRIGLVGFPTATAEPGVETRPIYLGKWKGSEFDGSLGTATGAFRGSSLSSISDIFNYDGKPWGERGGGLRGLLREAAVRAAGAIADSMCNNPPGFQITGR